MSVGEKKIKEPRALGAEGGFRTLDAVGREVSAANHLARTDIVY